MNVNTKKFSGVDEDATNKGYSKSFKGINKGDALLGGKKVQDYLDEVGRSRIK